MKAKGNNRTGRPVRLYLDNEAYDALKIKADEWGRSTSSIMSALIRILLRLKLSPRDKLLRDEINRVMGRDLFVAYLQAVGDAMPPSAKPIITGDKGVEYEPESWLIKKVGYLAFYNPVSENRGLVFLKATDLKNTYKLTKVYIIVPHPPVMDADFKRDLHALNIEVIPLADIKSTFNKNNRKRD